MKMDKMRKYALAKRARMILGVVIGLAILVGSILGSRQELIMRRGQQGSEITLEVAIFLAIAILALGSVIALAVVQHIWILPVEEELHKVHLEKYKGQLDAAVKAAWEKVAVVRAEVKEKERELEEAKAMVAALRRHDRMDSKRRPKA
ncbi:MAG: hypothetical protein EXS55_01055 [Candidatus Magasanikbacteria bacterium]|nr:hypothetical protein [Candidatus Magasanikbacteria bacterium]